jgi:hypothetical protein
MKLSVQINAIIFILQDKAQVLSDVRGIIAEQLGKEVDEVSTDGHELLESLWFWEPLSLIVTPSFPNLFEKYWKF